LEQHCLQGHLALSLLGGQPVGVGQVVAGVVVLALDEAKLP
jgi:hypothetical protein